MLTKATVFDAWPETKPYKPPLSTNTLQALEISGSQQGLNLWKTSLKAWKWIKSVKMKYNNT